MITRSEHSCSFIFPGGIRFKIYDILHQDISLVRTITPSAIRDVDYNALGSYFMVHVILRLNLMGH